MRYLAIALVFALAACGRNEMPQAESEEVILSETASPVAPETQPQPTFSLGTLPEGIVGSGVVCTSKTDSNDSFFMTSETVSAIQLNGETVSLVLQDAGDALYSDRSGRVQVWFMPTGGPVMSDDGSSSQSPILLTVSIDGAEHQVTAVEVCR